MGGAALLNELCYNNMLLYMLYVMMCHRMCELGVSAKYLKETSSIFRELKEKIIPKQSKSTKMNLRDAPKIAFDLDDRRHWKK